ncbi:alpha beta hydrolase [Cystoisospora suis]|uniref:Alpha beta hydrolase n=1 Tax=Cystoisospora suis TaxID=483139 RepID=A0A2C6KP89_9APIC|nr:alpha beta hydrolase [Cystoisospora suis]
MGQALQTLVFRPPTPPTYGPNGSLLWIPTEHGSVIPAFYLRRNSPLVVLYSHGNAEDLGTITPIAHRCAQAWDVSVFCYDYTGYGLSLGGSPSEANMYGDIEAAYMYLIRELDYSPHQIIALGKSLGSAAATHLASRWSVLGGLILQSAFASIYRVKLPHIEGHYPGDMCCNLHKIGRVRCPVLIVHGEQDALCAISHAKVLAEKHSGLTMTCYVSGGGHTNLCWGALAMRVDSAVLRFLGRVAVYSREMPYEAKTKMAAAARAEATDMATRLADTEAGVKARLLNLKRQRYTKRSWSSALRSTNSRPFYSRTISCTLSGATSLAGSAPVVLQSSLEVEEPSRPYRRTATFEADTYCSFAPYSRSSTFASSGGVSSSYCMEPRDTLRTYSSFTLGKGSKGAATASSLRALSSNRVSCAREQRTQERNTQPTYPLPSVFQLSDEAPRSNCDGDVKETVDEVEYDFSTTPGSRTSSSLESLPPLKYTEKATQQLRSTPTRGDIIQTSTATAGRVRTSTSFHDSVGVKFTREPPSFIQCHSGLSLPTTADRDINVAPDVTPAMSKMEHTLGIRMSPISGSGFQHGNQTSSLPYTQTSVKRYSTGSFSVFHSAGSYEGSRDSILARSVLSQTAA